MSQFRIIIAGTRTFNDRAKFEEECHRLIDQQISKWLWKDDVEIIIVSGMAPGPDTMAVDYAEEYGCEWEEYPADWDKHGLGAGPKRNTQMARVGDMLIAFWDGESEGTADMIEKATKRGLIVNIVNTKEQTQ